MTEPTRPAATKLYLKENWVFVPSGGIASATLAPTVAEITAGTVLDFTNIVFDDGAPEPGMTTNRVREKARYGDASTGEFIGETSHEGGDMTYVLNPQGAAGSSGKKMWEKIPEGTTGFLVRRQGIGKATAFAAGQFIDNWPVEFGPSKPVKAGEREAAQGAAMCTYAVGTPAFNIAVLA